MERTTASGSPKKTDLAFGKSEGKRKTQKVLLIVFLLCKLTPLQATVIKIGVVTDAHVGGTLNVPPSYYAETLIKLPTAMSAMNTADVDVLVECGDWVNTPNDLNDTPYNDIYELEAMWNDNITYSNLAGKPRLHVIGNHDFCHDGECWGGTAEKSKIMSIVGIPAGFVPGNAPCTYGHYDIGNLRIFVLDNCFDQNGDDWSSTQGYFSDSELAWLDNALSEADAAGKYSVCFHHHSIMPKYSAIQWVENESDYLDVLSRHKVVIDLGGHGHGYVADCVAKADNSEGTHILFKSLTPLITCSESGAAKANWCVIYLDDSSGHWLITGGTDTAYEKGDRVLRFTGGYSGNRNNPASAANWDVYDSTGNWSTNDTMNADCVLIFDQNYLVADPGTFIEDGLLGDHIQLTIAPNWTRPIGGEWGSYTGITFTRLDLLELGGGFAAGNPAANNMTWINVQLGISRVVVNGHAGNGGKHVLISNNYGPPSDRYWWDVDVNTGDDSYVVEFRDSLIKMSMRNLELYSGIVDLNDIHGANCTKDLWACTIYGGELRLSRGPWNVPVDANEIVMYGGTLDMTTGSNADNGKTIDKLTLKGRADAVNLDVGGITITNGIEVWREPTAFDFHAGTMHSFDFKTRASLVDNGDGISVKADYSPTMYLVVDAFSSYSDTNQMREKWTPSGNAGLNLANDKSHAGPNSMRVSHPNDISPYYSEASYHFSGPQGQNMRQDGYQSIMLWFDSAPDFNEPLYVKLTDASHHSYQVFPEITSGGSEWKSCHVSLSEFEDNGVNTENVTDMSIGLGDGAPAGTSGEIYFDDIRLYRTAGPPADINADNKVDFQDLAEFANSWLWQAESY